jgi:hypothetical protein
MARIDKNYLTLGLRGKFGDQFIFRKFKKRTIAVRAFDVPTRSTDAQRTHREKFRQATLYARRCMNIPELKAEYEHIANATDNSLFGAAVTDFLRHVTITHILCDGYNGKAGFPITIPVNDVYKVKTTKVMLIDSTGNLLEGGDAITTSGSSSYAYLTTVDVLDTAGMKIRVEVMDRPGNQVVKEVVFGEQSIHKLIELSQRR